METLILDWPLKLEPASPSAISTDEILLVDANGIIWPSDGDVEVIECVQASIKEQEPSSPEAGWSPDPNEDFHLPCDFLDDPILKEENDDFETTVATPRTRREMASKMLEDLDKMIKEEPFWLEEKMDLPLLPDLPSASESEVITLHPPTSVSNTQTLLQEFQSVFEQVSTCHDTPPQSPETVDAELAAVEALVRDRAERLVTIPTTPLQTIEPPAVTNCFKPEVPASPSSSSCDEGSDPDWQPSPVSVSLPKSMPVRRGRTPKSKPYVVPVEDRRLRKKEQNKNAATRYRQKKKAEVEEILTEERILEKKNTKLREQLNEIGREVKYLKGLMRDLCRAKGLIN